MAMKSAIEQVFINTKQRNCLFHIKTKCYNKNIKVFAANERLYEDFKDTMNNSLIVEEFKRLWKRMIEERNLQGNNYFSKMGEMRKRFIPVYYKNDFFPFIQTTSRSEATNARFKDNVGPTYSIISFLKEYNRIVDTINRAEKLEDNYSKQKRPKEYIFGYRIEQQAQQLYNRNIFKKFQLQLKATSRLNYRKTKDRKHLSKDRILCSHILKIVIEKEISTILEKYFLDKWRKKDMKQGKEGETIAAETGDPQTEIDVPERIQIKGRPPKPVGMKTHIEEIKKKMVEAENKKKKKTNDADSVGSPVKPKRKKRKETLNGSIDHQAIEL
ncbi:protein FAR1-RELATED SEQUENCE 5-like [Miscanthus floridulus]|uniref:protein FAR1-RELATED SEQUENCE 5-like n=1 Tax=Miscanthus floridulus TaxID=154761 RepID=UPI00345767C4